MNNLRWLAKRLLAALFVALVTGFLLGTSVAAYKVQSNDWLYYGLTHIVTKEFVRSWSWWIGGSIVLACVALAALKLLYRGSPDTEQATRRFSLATAVVFGGGLALHLGFQTNRYSYKSLWQPENAQSIFGMDIPAALLSPKLLLINGGILLGALGVAFVIHRLLQILLKRLENPFAWLADHWIALSVVCAVALSSLLWAVTSRQEVSLRPHVILISLDTLRADHLGCYGYRYKTSPNIDALARGGVVFENAFAQSNWTVPSHMSIMTSQIASSHGVRDFNHQLPAFKITLAEIMSNAGYATVAFTGGYNVDARYGFDQGFDSYHGDKAHHLAHEEKIKYGKGVRLSTLMPDILAWVSAHQQQPFFMFVHSYDVHAPYIPHPEFIEEFSRSYDGDLSMVTHELVAELHRNPEKASPEDRRRIHALYDNEIRHVDETLGQLFKHLASLGLIERSIIILTSDHGDELLEHGFGHGLFLFDPEIHIPLIISYPPAVEAGLRIKSLARSIDILPTLLDLARLQVPREVKAELQGRRLLPLQPGYEKESVAFSEADIGNSIRTLRHKYIVQQAKDGGPPVESLYDLLRDPLEQTDLASMEIEVKKEMEDLLTLYLRRLPAVRFTGVTQEVPLSDDALEKLKALGYVQ